MKINTLYFRILSASGQFLHKKMDAYLKELDSDNNEEEVNPNLEGFVQNACEGVLKKPQRLSLFCKTEF
jgi:hypothetical protein